MLKFGERGYWDQRYIDDAEATSSFQLFDWYAPFDSCYPTIESMIDFSKEHRVLIIGVGKSGSIETLYKKGFRNIVAIDISPTLIRQMQQKYISYSGVEFMCVDVRKMSIFPDKSFTVVIDKACLDALFCEINYVESVKEALSEIFRVMAAEALFTSVSHASPLARVPYLRQIPWAVEVLPLPFGCGEGLSCYAIVRTEDVTLLTKRVKGSEFANQAKSGKTVMSLKQQMNKVSTVKTPANMGSLTVTASPDLLVDLVRRNASEGDEALLRGGKQKGP